MTQLTHISETAGATAGNPTSATAGEAAVTDSNGRRLTLKRPNALAQYRLVDAIGASAENRVYLAMCVPLLYLDAIDGDKLLPPSSKLQIEHLIQRLDDAGLAALNAGIDEHFGAPNEKEETNRAKP